MWFCYGDYDVSVSFVEIFFFLCGGCVIIICFLFFFVIVIMVMVMFLCWVLKECY